MMGDSKFVHCHTVYGNHKNKIGFSFVLYKYSVQSLNLTVFWLEFWWKHTCMYTDVSVYPDSHAFLFGSCHRSQIAFILIQYMLHTCTGFCFRTMNSSCFLYIVFRFGGYIHVHAQMMCVDCIYLFLRSHEA